MDHGHVHVPQGHVLPVRTILASERVFRRLRDANDGISRPIEGPTSRSQRRRSIWVFMRKERKCGGAASIRTLANNASVYLTYDKTDGSAADHRQALGLLGRVAASFFCLAGDELPWGATRDRICSFIQGHVLFSACTWGLQKGNSCVLWIYSRTSYFSRSTHLRCGIW
jgi:hypothetical protein